MNIIMWIYRRLFECPRGLHTIFLEPDEFQVLSEVNLIKFCNVCKIQIPLRKEEMNVNWKVVDDDDEGN